MVLIFDRFQKHIHCAYELVSKKVLKIHLGYILSLYITALYYFSHNYFLRLTTLIIMNTTLGHKLWSVPWLIHFSSEGGMVFGDGDSLSTPSLRWCVLGCMVDSDLCKAPTPRPQGCPHASGRAPLPCSPPACISAPCSEPPSGGD